MAALVRSAATWAAQLELILLQTNRQQRTIPGFRERELCRKPAPLHHPRFCEEKTRKEARIRDRVGSFYLDPENNSSAWPRYVFVSFKRLPVLAPKRCSLEI